MSRSKNLLVPDFSIICCFERVPLDSWYRYRSRDKMVGDPKKSTRDISFEQFVLEWADGSPLGGAAGGPRWDTSTAMPCSPPAYNGITNRCRN